MNELNPLFEAYASGQQTILVAGRSLFDLHVNSKGEIRPLRHTLINEAKERHQMATLAFNLCLGARWDYSAFSDSERVAFEEKLTQSQAGLIRGAQDASDQQRGPHNRAFRLLAALQKSFETAAEMPPILMLWELAEDLVPRQERGAQGNDYVVQISELIQLIAADYQMRRHPFLLVINGVSDRMDERVVNSLKPVDIPQPNREQKLEFIQALRQSPRHQAAVFEPGMDERSVANMTAQTPNRGLEEVFYASSRSETPIRCMELVERKRHDVIAMSDGTLSVLDTERVKSVKLVGRSIQKPFTLLMRWAEQLRQGNPYTPTNILLAGAPSTAKTDLALLTAETAQVATYALINPKGSLVGDSERRVRLQFRIFKMLGPAFGFIDEITEAFPMERGTANLDSGASASVTAEMLNALSDSSRAGKTILVATTNCPWRIGAAMSSRFLFVPVLSAIVEDFPEILASIAGNLFPEYSFEVGDSNLQEAARLFYQKGATPRLMRSLITSKFASEGEAPTSRLLLSSARVCAMQDPRDRASAEYADLFAIRVCSNLEMLPWYGQMDNYPLPAHLRGIVSEIDGSVDLDALNHRIQQLAPNVNV